MAFNNIFSSSFCKLFLCFGDCINFFCFFQVCICFCLLDVQQDLKKKNKKLFFKKTFSALELNFFLSGAFNKFFLQ